jgi:hypothetical protein
MSLVITDIKTGIIYLEDESIKTFYAIADLDKNLAKVYTTDISERYPHERVEFLKTINSEVDLNELLLHNPDPEAKRQIECYLSGINRIPSGLSSLVRRLDNFKEWRVIREKRSFDNVTLDNIILILDVFCNQSPFKWNSLLTKTFINSVIKDTEQWIQTRKSRKLSIKYLQHSSRLMYEHVSYISQEAL